MSVRSNAVAALALTRRATPRPLKKAVRTLAESLGRSLPERAENAYATHIPILIGLASLLRPTRILELGCGDYSTQTFLDRAIFPELTMLRSIETDAGWGRRIAGIIEGDARAAIEMVQGSTSLAVARMDVRMFDLIFVDDSQRAEERAATIRAVAEQQTSHSVVVIHDFEVKDYQKAARLFHRTFSFSAVNPCTGVAWNEADLNPKHLRWLNELVRRHANSVELEDSAEWLRIFSESKAPWESNSRH